MKFFDFLKKKEEKEIAKKEPERTCTVCYNHKAIHDLIYEVTEQTRQLLEEKGFSNCLKTSCAEKFVLLGTEISELADAVKKGKGTEEEKMEIADILIRACNFLCSIEVYNSFLAINHYIKTEEDEFIRYEFKVDEDIQAMIMKMQMSWYNKANDNVVPVKYSIISEMMKINHAIGVQLDTLSFLEEKDEKAHVEIYYKICHLVMVCGFYADLFLGDEKMQDFTQRKMDINFKRPYKYNTFEENKK